MQVRTLTDNDLIELGKASVAIAQELAKRLEEALEALDASLED